MHKVLSWKKNDLFRNFWYFSKITIAVRTGTIVIIPVYTGTLFVTSNPIHMPTVATGHRYEDTKSY